MLVLRNIFMKTHVARLEPGHLIINHDVESLPRELDYIFIEYKIIGLEMVTNINNAETLKHTFSNGILILQKKNVYIVNIKRF